MMKKKIRRREKGNKKKEKAEINYLSASCICLLSCILKSEMSPWNLDTVRLSHIQISFATCEDEEAEKREGRGGGRERGMWGWKRKRDEKVEEREGWWGEREGDTEGSERGREGREDGVRGKL